MPKLIILIVAALAGAAFWRRKTPRSDVAHAKDAGVRAASSAKAKLLPGAQGTSGDTATSDAATDAAPTDGGVLAAAGQPGEAAAAS
jgi:hypothetical protein